jgi:hypothetical protein
VGVHFQRVPESRYEMWEETHTTALWRERRRFRSFPGAMSAGTCLFSVLLPRVFECIRGAPFHEKESPLAPQCRQWVNRTPADRLKCRSINPLAAIGIISRTSRARKRKGGRGHLLAPSLHAGRGSSPFCGKRKLVCHTVDASRAAPPPWTTKIRYLARPHT